MKIYASSTPAFAAQLARDALLVGWLLMWLWIGSVVNDGVETLAEPGLRISSSAGDLADSLSDAGGALEEVPVVGDDVATPFDKASSASRSMAAAGDSEARAADRAAFWLGFTVAALPILYVAPRYLRRRVRWIREATAGQRFLDSEADLEIFALRAVNNQPLHVLAGVSDDPVGALRRRDAREIEALAVLELRRTGLELPRVVMARS